MAPKPTSDVDRWPANERLLANIVVRGRLLLGLTQAELAKELGVARLTVIRWETLPVDQIELDRHVKAIRKFEAAVKKWIQFKFTQIGPYIQAGAAENLSAYLAYVFVAGGEARMGAEGWRALGIGKKLLNDLPATDATAALPDPQRKYWGYDVAWSAIATLDGERYHDWIPNETQRFDRYACATAENFLLNLVKARIETLQWLFGLDQFNTIIEKARGEKRTGDLAKDVTQEIVALIPHVQQKETKKKVARKGGKR